MLPLQGKQPPAVASVEKTTHTSYVRGPSIIVLAYTRQPTNTGITMVAIGTIPYTPTLLVIPICAKVIPDGTI